MSLGPLHGPTKVKLVGIEYEAILWNRNPSDSITFSHVKHDFFVDQYFIMQGKIIAVGIEVLFIKGINNDILAKMGFYFIP